MSRNILQEKLNFFINAEKKGMLDHAYLLSGGMHGGQDLLAEELYSFLLCTDSKVKEKKKQCCSKCNMCRLISAGTHPDLHMLEKPEDKSKIPVSDVRAFTEKAYRKSYYGG
ncbi:MAG: hypothetical protein ACOCWO_01390, partial [Candidatus Muiribacteriaceae bacterium]